MGIKLTESQRLMIIIIIISCAFFITEVSVGFYTRALVLVADAFHYLTDLIGYIVVFITFRVSERENAPRDLPFGWQRATLLGAFFNGVFLLALGMSIFLQSIERFVAIERVENPKLVLIVGCVGLALNLMSAAILHGESHGSVPDSSSRGIRMRAQSLGDHQTHRHMTSLENRPQKGHYDLDIAGVLLHIMGDAANNIRVIIAAVVIWKTSSPARFYADPAVSMNIAIMIMVSSLPLSKKSGSISMQRMPDGVELEDVKHDLETVPGVLTVHDLHVWLLNPEKALVSAHVLVNEEKIKSMDDFMNLANTVNECFYAYGIHSTTLQPEMTRLAGVPSASPAERELHQRATLAETSCRVGCRSVSCEEPTCCD